MDALPTNDTVLYVDDDPSNLTVFEAAYSDEFTILTAASGAEALEILARKPVAVLLVDQRMPGMSGVELLERARAEFPDPVRILITAYSDLGEAIEAINRGHVRRYLRKPWDSEELRATLRDAIEVHHSRHQLDALERRLVETERVYALGVVAAGVAHELRNPLTILMGTLEIADLKAGRVRDALAPAAGEEGDRALSDLARHLASAREAVEQISEITDSIALGHRRRGTEQQADLGEVVRLTMRSVQGALRHRAQTRVELEPVPPVLGSATQLGQITLNLLVNALQAMPEGGGSEHSIDIRLRQEADRGVLEIQDTGPGIAADDLARIFHPFFTTKDEGGTGLGLAISRKIIEELGGSIDVESELGRGSCFTVRIPLAPTSSI